MSPLLSCPRKRASSNPHLGCGTRSRDLEGSPVTGSPLSRGRHQRISRRAFIALLGAAAWPRGSRAQQRRRIGVLSSTSETDPEGQRRVAALRQGLRELGWIEGRTIEIDYRWVAGDPSRGRALAAELVAS